MSIISGVSAGEAGSSSFYDHAIDQSLKLDDASGAHLTISSASPTATDRKKVTISCWVKRAGRENSEVYTVYWGSTGGLMLQFFADNRIYIYDSGSSFQAYVGDGAVQVFRDFSAWYHLVLIIDTTQSTATDTAKFYVNGTQLDLNSHPGQNNLINWHTGTTMKIGNPNDSTDLAGYIAEFISIDGQNVSISDFGETKDGVWVPKDVSGLNLGDAGFYLKFDNKSDIGNDSGSNNVDFTASNIATTDVVPDSPTNNFAAFNPLIPYYNTSYPAVFSEGNLKVYRGDNNWVTALSTLAVSSGKWYAEFVATVQGTYIAMGILDIGAHNDVSSGFFIGEELNSVSYYGGNGYKYVSQAAGGSTTSYGATFGLGDIIGVALDLDAGTVKFYKNNTVQNSGTAAATSLSGTFAFGAAVYGNNAIVANFGQDGSFAGYLTGGNVGTAADGNGIGAFKYAPPSDHLALCASNLPDPTIGPGQDSQPDDNFNTVIYTGDADNDVTVTNTFSADFVWIKSRSGSSTNHYLQDIVRGFGASKSLSTNALGQEGYNGGAPSSHNIVPGSTSLRLVSSDFASNSVTYVAWTWKLGGTANTNTDGTGISSSVSANAAAGFSIVTYTGTGNTSHTIGHGLGKTPAFVMSKSRDTGSGAAAYWFVKWKGLTSNYNLVYFDDAETDIATNYAGGGWSDFDSTNTTTLVPRIGYTGSSVDSVNKSGEDYVAWVFAEIEGFSSIGSYVGNGLADGTFVHTGFRPAFLMLKSTGSGNWSTYDNKRDIDNVVSEYLIPNNSDQAGSTATVDFVSNGFKIRNAGAYINTDGQKYVYMAFAKNPFKFANAR